MVKRAKLLGTGFVALLGIAAVYTGLGPASAQSGSRICGDSWEGTALTPDLKNVVELHYNKVAEVPIANAAANADIICGLVKDELNRNTSVDEIPQWGKLRNIEWKKRQDISFETCEDFGKYEAGGVYDADPCNGMNRVDTAFEDYDPSSFPWQTIPGKMLPSPPTDQYPA
jgi:hypothetical protein